MGLASAFEADLQNWMEDQGTPESMTEDEDATKTGNQLQGAAGWPPLESSSDQWQGGIAGMSGSPTKETSEEDSEPESDEEEMTEHQRQLLERGTEVMESSDAESGELVDEEDDEKPPMKKRKVEEGEMEGGCTITKKRVEEEEVEEGELSSDDSSEKVSKGLSSFDQMYLFQVCFYLMMVYLLSNWRARVQWLLASMTVLLDPWQTKGMM